MAGQQRSLLLQTLGASGSKAYGTSYKRGSILENLLVTRRVCISYYCYYYYYYYLSVCLVCQTPKICRVWGRKGDTELFTCPTPCVSHPEWLLKISEGSLCFCCPGEMCSHSCFYQTMATFKFRGCSSPEWNGLSPEGVQKSGDLEPSSLLKFKASFQGHIPIYRDNPSWIWHMCINLNLSLFLY